MRRGFLELGHCVCRGCSGQHAPPCARVAPSPQWARRWLAAAVAPAATRAARPARATWTAQQAVSAGAGARRRRRAGPRATTRESAACAGASASRASAGASPPAPHTRSLGIRARTQAHGTHTQARTTHACNDVRACMHMLHVCVACSRTSSMRSSFPPPGGTCAGACACAAGGARCGGQPGGSTRRGEPGLSPASASPPAHALCSGTHCGSEWLREIGRRAAPRPQSPSGAAATASPHAVAGNASSTSRSSCCACGLLPTPAVAGVRLSVS